MLFIYGSLSVGGIETFFVRMAKERARLGLSTSMLLLSKPESGNDELLAEAKKYARVMFAEEIFLFKPSISSRLCLLAPINKDNLTLLFKYVDQIHTFDGMHALFGLRLSKIVNRRIPITIGFYHYIKYLWGGDKVALHEKINRQFVFDYLPSESLLFFSKGSRDLYSKHQKKNFDRSNVFRLGVVDHKEVPISGSVNTPFKVVAIGRLVEFKTYNFYMIDVMKSLIDKGFNIQFDIYGDGPLFSKLKQRIENEGLTEHIKLNGTLNYSKFDQVVSQSDMFIGDGTAIIQASALGVPSIVGVQNVVEPKTYGYFCNVFEFQYGRKGLDIPLISVEELILKYIRMDASERLEIKQQHLNCIDQFTNESCQASMDRLKNIEMPLKNFRFNRLTYLFSSITDNLNKRFNKKHPFNMRHEELKNE
ncbi:Glycosyl transferases group 1 [Pseudoalteromonas carrageenovora]|uniref:Glycosyl transferase family 1 domain-containing protein n=1 Tax=Pseudoalteromonas carrageenovora IAM 12662 TaxID=1314868 RepID=A0ABR9EN13_PSEVC|nr:glycosyltransferase family 4 protein [Pseudoalteromonas carrageenovora]MBE0381924.1 hypothetical protein [Pseudoalteromonas carrageenovora IAM 12662]QBJ70668.1 Glycosyl transferases group 1 [Pseudoalteromonas carrageenovora]GEB69776.1 hypothetical protein PCA01_04860 [Pseudoalteromonas carrageenovora]